MPLLVPVYLRRTMQRYFIEIALGSVAARGRGVPLTDIPLLQKQAYENNLELYRSYYYFDYSLMEHLKVYKTVKGFPGTPFIDLLTLDVDKEKDTDEQTKLRAVALYHQLKDLDISDCNIRPYYSGNGYHFILPNLWKFETPEEVKATLLDAFPGCDSIYDKSRLIRVANTLNAKTGRYKIPLTHKELLHGSVDDILRESARARPSFNYFPPFEIPAVQLKKIIPVKPLTSVSPKDHETGTSNVILCIQNLYNSKPVKGFRHKSMLRMISVFKRNGVPRSGIELMMQTWAGRDMEMGEIRKIVSDVFDKNYQYSCQDEIMSKHCDERCIFFQKKGYNAVIPRDVLSIEKHLRETIGEVHTKYIDIAEFCHLSTPFGIYPEEFVVIEGDTGLGKSALIQNILVKARSFKCLYLNFEVGERLMYRRFLQIAHGKTKIDILQHYSDPQAETLSSEIDHIDMISDRLSVPTLEHILAEGKYDIVVADTLEGFSTPGINDITPKTEFLSHEMKRIAKKYKVINIAIHHVSKSSVQNIDGSIKKLTVHAGKGSSAVEQEADKVLLLEGSIASSVRLIRSAKARDEHPFNTTMMFDAERTFRFYKEQVWTSEDYSENDSSPSAFPVKVQALPASEEPLSLQ